MATANESPPVQPLEEWQAVACLLADRLVERCDNAWRAHTLHGDLVNYRDREDAVQAVIMSAQQIMQDRRARQR